MHSTRVLKSLQLLRFWRRSIYDARVTLVFISNIETVHFFCAKKLKPVLGYNLKPISTNRLRPKIGSERVNIFSWYWLTGVFSDKGPLNGLLLMITECRFRCFSHSACSAPNEDHHHAVAAMIWKPPFDWKQLPGRPITHNSEPKPLNLIWDHWTSVLPMHGRRHPLEKTSVQLWTQRCRAMKRGKIIHFHGHNKSPSTNAAKMYHILTSELSTNSLNAGIEEDGSSQRLYSLRYLHDCFNLIIAVIWNDLQKTN